MLQLSTRSHSTVLLYCIYVPAPDWFSHSPEEMNCLSSTHVTHHTLTAPFSQDSQINTSNTSSHLLNFNTYGTVGFHIVLNIIPILPITNSLQL